MEELTLDELNRESGLAADSRSEFWFEAGVYEAIPSRNSV
jgi:hypothetical protein